jgi:hypothetical protein
MTEQASLTDQVIRPTYEQIRDGMPHKEARELWREADMRVEHTRRAMQDVHDDESLSEEGKREKAQRIIDTNAPKILKGYEDARKKVETSAESSWQFSIPMPDGKALANTPVSDSSEMVAVQNEANTVAMRMEGKSLQELTKERSRNPRDKGMQEAGDSKLHTLRAEFGEPMQVGGVEGKVRALAVKRVCDAKGIRLDDVVDHHRTDRHHRAYQDAERYENAVPSIPNGRSMTQNPYDGKRRRGPSAIGTYSSGNKAMVSSGKPQIFQTKKRRPAWK